MSSYPVNDYRDYLEHSAKGQKWSNHKYLYITPSGRYVYSEGVSRRGYSGASAGATVNRTPRTITRPSLPKDYWGYGRNNRVYVGPNLKGRGHYGQQKPDMSRAVGGSYEGGPMGALKTRKKRTTVRLASSRTGTFEDRLESALYNTIKKSAKKLMSEKDNPTKRKRLKKRSIFARYFGRKRFGGRTSTKNGRRGSYSSRSRKF